MYQIVENREIQTMHHQREEAVKREKEAAIHRPPYPKRGRGRVRAGELESWRARELES